MYVMKQSGWIEVICGSMFSGKSEELIRRVRRAQFARQNIVVFKPSIDNRYSDENVCSHNGNQIIAISISNSIDIFKHVTFETDLVAIDEIQFFDENIVEVVVQLANKGYRVVVAGLDLDFRGVPFGSVPSLMAMAESVTKLQAVCHVCGSPAWCSQRLVDGKPAPYDGSIIQVGAAESYEARCRHHHVIPGKPSSINIQLEVKS